MNRMTFVERAHQTRLEQSRAVGTQYLERLYLAAAGRDVGKAQVAHRSLLLADRRPGPALFPPKSHRHPHTG